jgi:hypothetical protein
MLRGMWLLSNRYLVFPRALSLSRSRAAADACTLITNGCVVVQVADYGEAVGKVHRGILADSILDDEPVPEKLTEPVAEESKVIPFLRYTLGGAYDVFEAGVGNIGEKFEEYRNDTPANRSKLLHSGSGCLKRFNRVVLYRATPYFDYNGRYFVAEYITHELRRGVSGMAGPYSNGYSKRFSGDVWVVRTGRVVYVHAPTLLQREPKVKRERASRAKNDTEWRKISRPRWRRWT